MKVVPCLAIWELTQGINHFSALSVTNSSVKVVTYLNTWGHTWEKNNFTALSVTHSLVIIVTYLSIWEHTLVRNHFNSLSITKNVRKKCIIQPYENTCCLETISSFWLQHSTFNCSDCSTSCTEPICPYQNTQVTILLNALFMVANTAKFELDSTRWETSWLMHLFNYPV